MYAIECQKSAKNPMQKLPKNFLKIPNSPLTQTKTPQKSFLTNQKSFMRILTKNKNPKNGDTVRLTTVFALLPKKCWDVESRLEFWIWLEPIKKVYIYKANKWVVDHYLTFSLTNN